MLRNPFRIAAVFVLGTLVLGYAQTGRKKSTAENWKLAPPTGGPADSAVKQATQPCQDLALNTVRQARQSASAGAKDKARKLLDQAELECGTSPLVRAEMGAVYLQLGDTVLAAVYLPTGPATPVIESFVREKYAVIVGVGKFSDPKIPTLKYSGKDARDFAAMLVDPAAGRFHSENVTVLTDEQATTKAIKNALADVAAKALRDDLVVLYFSTHGSSPSMDNSKAGSGYLITHDTDLGGRLYASAFGMDDLADFIGKKLRAERIVTFLDTCYSGDATRHVAGAKTLEIDALSPQSIGQIAQGKGSVVITSSSNQELSWETDEKQNSFFTLYLIDSMRSRQGLANIYQTYTDIQRKVPAAVRDYTQATGKGEKGKGASQNPQIYPRENVPNIVIGTPIK